MPGEVNSKEFSDEISRNVNEDDYKSQIAILPQASASDTEVQGVLRFFQSVLTKLLQINPDLPLEHQLAYIFDQWVHLTDENRNLIKNIAIIHNQEDCNVSLPDDLDVSILQLLTFNMLDCLVESLLENYETYPVKHTASLEKHTDYLKNTMNYTTDNNMVPNPPIIGDVFFEDNIVIDFRVSLIDAYHASELLLNWDENDFLE